MKEFFNSDYKEQELEFQKRAAKAKGNIDEKKRPSITWRVKNCNWRRF